MPYQFTPAADRALLAASGWATGDVAAEIQPPHVLLGLLSEPESRAASLLASRGIDSPSVMRRWPELHPVQPSLERATRFCSALVNSLWDIRERHCDDPRSLVLATEHLLLGVALAEHDAAGWLIEHGLEPVDLENHIAGLHAQALNPLPVDFEATDPPKHAMVGEPLAGEWVAGVERSEPPASSPSSQRTAALRVLDAAANRASEGLRVVEDYVRFALDDHHLTEQFKQLRHDLQAALSGFDAAELLNSRETLADVGTDISTPSEQRRADLAGLVLANCKRIEESLRSLEEYGKLINPAAAAEIEQLRYRCYTLERAVAVTARSLDRLAAARLYVLIDGRPTLEEFAELVQRLVLAGVHVLQLRDKALADADLLARARALRSLTRGTSTLMIVNDRADLAALAEADGVHVGQEELGVKDVRAIVGPRMLVGISTHSLAQAEAAVLSGADYLGVGPVFPSGTKSFNDFPGLELLREVSTNIRLPAFAIGGIDVDNLPHVLATGFARVAVSGAIVSSADPALAASRLLAALRESYQPMQEEATS